MEAWVTRGTCPQENGELGVRVHVHVCVHSRTHTQENCQNTDFHALPCFHPQRSIHRWGNEQAKSSRYGTKPKSQARKQKSKL